jgi:hypothetical protein
MNRMKMINAQMFTQCVGINPNTVLWRKNGKPRGDWRSLVSFSQEVEKTGKTIHVVNEQVGELVVSPIHIIKTTEPINGTHSLA